MTFSEAPHKLGLPTIHSGYWEPFFAACAETETVISLHVGSAGETVDHLRRRADRGHRRPLRGLLVHLRRWTGSTRGSPSGSRPSRSACPKGGIGWVGAVIDRVDHLNVRQDELGVADLELRHLGRVPTELLVLRPRRPVGVPDRRRHRRGQHLGRVGLPALRLDVAQHPGPLAQAPGRRARSRNSARCAGRTR